MLLLNSYWQLSIWISHWISWKFISNAKLGQTLICGWPRYSSPFHWPLSLRWITTHYLRIHGKCDILDTSLLSVGFPWYPLIDHLKREDEHRWAEHLLPWAGIESGPMDMWLGMLTATPWMRWGSYEVEHMLPFLVPMTCLAIISLWGSDVPMSSEETFTRKKSLRPTLIWWQVDSRK